MRLEERKAAIERRAKLAADVAAIAKRAEAEGRDLTAEDLAQVEAMKPEFARLGEQLRADDEARAKLDFFKDTYAPTVAGGVRAKGGDGASEGDGDPIKPDEARRLALSAWMRAKAGLPLTHKQKRACRIARVNPREKEFVFRLGRAPRNLRDMSVGTGSAGGFFVPQGFSYEFEKFLLYTSPLRAVSRVIRTESGNTMPYPTVSDTGNLGELLAENAATATVDPTIGQINFASYKYGSRLIPVSYELLNDSAFDMETMIGELAGERIGRSQNAAFTTGTGTAQPQGVVTGASAGITTASATAIAATEVIRLAHTIDPAYRDSPNIAYMMHDNIKLQLALLNDSQNRPLFMASYRDGEVDKVYGRPVYANNGMASTIATTNITMLYGDFSKFIIRDAGDVRLRRLEERYADKDQVGFVAFLRSDSRVVNTNAIKRLTQV